LEEHRRILGEHGKHWGKIAGTLQGHCRDIREQWRMFGEQWGTMENNGECIENNGEQWGTMGNNGEHLGKLPEMCISAFPCYSTLM